MATGAHQPSNQVSGDESKTGFRSNSPIFPRNPVSAPHGRSTEFASMSSSFPGSIFDHEEGLNAKTWNARRV